MRHIRSLLFVPANKPARLTKALDLGADAWCFDLEDSVPDDEEGAAQLNLLAFLGPQGPVVGRPELVTVRPSRIAQVTALRDAGCRVDAIVVPKVQDASDLAPYVSLAWKPVIATIESARACVNLLAIARTGIVGGLIFGAGDFAASIGVMERGHADIEAQPDPPTKFDYARGAVVTHAAAFNLAAFDTCTLVRDHHAEASVAAHARRSVLLGFTGLCCLHPHHVVEANRLFASDDERRCAERVMAQLDDSGPTLDDIGVVIGPPTKRQARRVLDRIAPPPHPAAVEEDIL